MNLDKAILSLRHAASTDETRRNLTGIYLTPGKAIATSGFILASITTEGGEELKPCILSALDAAAIEKALPKKPKYGEAPVAVVNVEGANLNGHLPVTIGTTEMKPAKVEGEFPDVTRVEPTSATKYSLTFNADLFWNLVEIAKAADTDGKRRGIVTIEVPEDSLKDGELVGPMRIVASTAPRFSGLLMPCRK